MMEEQKCEFCVWYDYNDKPEADWDMNISWCNKWEAPAGPTNYCGWYVPKDN